MWFNGHDLEGAIRDISLAGGIIAAGLALWTFWRSAKVRRAEWLSSLHARFYETERYKHVRQVLDYQIEPELTRLRAAVISNEYDDLVEQFVDYLNFFELVASLHQLGQLKQKEIDMLFQYYLSLLSKLDFVRQYVRREDFQNLEKLLTAGYPQPGPA